MPSPPEPGRDALRGSPISCSGSTRLPGPSTPRGPAWRFLIPWTGLDWPLDWTACFGRDRPLRIEVGFGDGEYLLRAAQAEPEVNWVGVEISWYSLRRLLKRLRHSGLENVRVLQADGAFALERLFPDGSLDAVVANHSDPWPKLRHHSRRLVQDRFLGVVAGRLQPGGTLTLATDHAGYAEWIAQTLRRSKRLRSLSAGERLHEIPGRPPTKYERKGRAAGSVIHYFIWESVGVDPRYPPRPGRPSAMHQVTLEGSVEFAFLLRDFPGADDRFGEGEDAVRLRLRHAFLRADGGEWLVEARVDDGGFVQHLALSVTPREASRYLVGPSGLGFPRSTPGVARAIQLLAEFLLQAHPSLRATSTRPAD